MKEKLINKLIIIERKVRILLYGFIAYSLIYCVVMQTLPKQAENIVDNYVFIILASVFSFCAGLVIDEEVEDIKKEYEWDWKPKTKLDYFCTEWCGLIGIGTLYLMVQMGIGMIFFPWFDKVQIGEHYIYPYVFIFNSIIIYIIYRSTIIKIEKAYVQG